MQWFDAIVLRGELCYYFAGSIPAPVVHRDDFVDIFSIERQDLLNQRPDVHLLIVRRDHNGDSSAK